MSVSLFWAFTSIHDYSNPKCTSVLSFIACQNKICLPSHYFQQVKYSRLLRSKSVDGLQRRARLSTTNTEAFRCVSDSFTTHTDTSDPLSPSEEVCPLKRWEKHCSAELQPAKKCRNVRNIFKSDGKLPRQGTEMSISAGSSISRTARAIKSAKCNILLDRVKLSIHSQTPLPHFHRFPTHLNPSVISNPFTDVSHDQIPLDLLQAASSGAPLRWPTTCPSSQRQTAQTTVSKEKGSRAGHPCDQLAVSVLCIHA